MLFRDVGSFIYASGLSSKSLSFWRTEHPHGVRVANTPWWLNEMMIHFLGIYLYLSRWNFVILLALRSIQRYLPTYKLWNTISNSCNFHGQLIKKNQNLFFQLLVLHFSFCIVYCRQNLECSFCVCISPWQFLFQQFPPRHHLLC